MCCSLPGARGVCAGGSEAPRPLVSRAHGQGDFRLAGSSALALLRCSSPFMGSRCVATAAGEPGGRQSPGAVAGTHVLGEGPGPCGRHSCSRPCAPPCGASPGSPPDSMGWPPRLCWPGPRQPDTAPRSLLTCARGGRGALGLKPASPRFWCAPGVLGLRAAARRAWSHARRRREARGSASGGQCLACRVPGCARPRGRSVTVSQTVGHKGQWRQDCAVLSQLLTLLARPAVGHRHPSRPATH